MSCRENNADRLLELIKQQPGIQIQQAADKLRRGIRYTRSLAENELHDCVITHAPGTLVREWQLFPHIEESSDE